MRKLILFLSLLLVSLGSGLSAQELPREFLITSGAAGSFILNESIYAVLERLKDEKKSKFGEVKDGEEIVPCVFIYIDDFKKYSLVLKLKKTFDSSTTSVGASDDVVAKIEIFDKRFKTDHGIGVGSTYAELEAQYEIQSKNCTDVKLGRCTVVVRNVSAEFIFEIKTRAVAKLLSREGEELVVPNDAKIDSIAIGYLAKM